MLSLTEFGRLYQTNESSFANSKRERDSLERDRKLSKKVLTTMSVDFSKCTHPSTLFDNNTYSCIGCGASIGFGFIAQSGGNGEGFKGGATGKYADGCAGTQSSVTGEQFVDTKKAPKPPTGVVVPGISKPPTASKSKIISLSINFDSVEDDPVGYRPNSRRQPGLFLSTGSDDDESENETVPEEDNQPEIINPKKKVVIMEDIFSTTATTASGKKVTIVEQILKSNRRPAPIKKVVESKASGKKKDVVPVAAKKRRGRPPASSKTQLIVTPSPASSAMSTETTIYDDDDELIIPQLPKTVRRGGGGSSKRKGCSNVINFKDPEFTSLELLDTTNPDSLAPIYFNSRSSKSVTINRSEETDIYEGSIELTSAPVKNLLEEDIPLVVRHNNFLKKFIIDSFDTGCCLLTGAYTFRGGGPCEKALRIVGDSRDNAVLLNSEILKEALSIADSNMAFFFSQRRRPHVSIFLITAAAHAKVVHPKCETVKDVSEGEFEGKIPLDLYECLDLERVNLRIKPSSSETNPRALSIALSTRSTMNVNCIAKVIPGVLKLYI